MALIPLVIALAALVAIVLTFVFVPLARGGASSAASRERFARAVYRDQLREIERDRARGIIDPDQEQAARREIERRLIAADRPEQDSDKRARPVLAISLAVITLAVAGGFYALLGRPGMPDLPYAARRAERAIAAHQMPSDLNKAVADLKAKLKAHPDDLNGWVLLGRTEAVRRHWEQSAQALRHAVTLSKNRPDIVTAYAEIQVMADGGLVTPTARDAFEKVLAKQPKNERALWYLGLGAVQQRHVGTARDYWRRLLALLPEKSAEHKTVAKALATIDKAEKAAQDAAKPTSP